MALDIFIYLLIYLFNYYVKLISIYQYKDLKGKKKHWKKYDIKKMIENKIFN